MKPTIKVEKTEAPQDEFTVKDLIKSGIPLRKAVFKRTVLSYGGEKAGVPETGLFAPSPKGQIQAALPSRTANLWYTPHGVVVEQKGKYKVIPLASVSDTDVL